MAHHSGAPEHIDPDNCDAMVRAVLERLALAVGADYADVQERIPDRTAQPSFRTRYLWTRDALLEENGDRQIAAFPVLVDGVDWGRIRFARDCGAEWPAVTPESMRVAAEIVGAAIQQSRSRENPPRELAASNRASGKSELLYRTLMETSPDAIALTDPQGRLQIVNRRGLELFGYQSTEHVVGREIEEFLRTADPETLRKVREELLSSGHLRDLELRLTRCDGSVFDAEVNGTVVRDADGAPEYILWMARDISRRKAAEQEMQQSARWFRAIFDDAPIGIALAGANTRIQASNRAFQEMVEYSEEELGALQFRDFTHPEDRAAIERVVDSLQFVSAPVQVLDTRYVTKSGRVVWARSTVANLLALSEGEQFMVAMVEDVTARKHLEEQFRQSQKMEAVGRLAGGIAHDFNNVLTVIKGYGELLQKRVAQDESAARKASQIVKAAERAALLVAQLLAFSRKHAAERKVLDVNGLLREMRGMLGRLLREDIKLTTRLDPDAGSVLGDHGQFGQLVMNLAVNARDAMPQGGRLSISTRPEEVRTAPAAEGAGPAPGRYTVLEVTDTGCGMNPEVLSRIFEPFFTTKDVGKGTGLGLSTVYGIVQQAGGHIAVESAPGAGTTFRIYLPSVAAVSPAEADGGPLTPGEGGSETILLTEDEDPVRDIMAETLRERGYTVLEARHGSEALQLAAGRRGRIDLLLTDVVMPQMGGPELWGRIRERFPDARVLFLSGHTGTPLGLGAALLHKPFSTEDLVARVRDALDAPVAVA